MTYTEEYLIKVIALAAIKMESPQGKRLVFLDANRRPTEA